jgi:poly(3-hydroxybutyrate) depolymerase
MILDELITSLSVDTSRMYVVGFSNGGNMAGRCGIELSHRFAASVMHAGSLPADTSFSPARAVPMCLSVGNKDPRWLEFSGLPVLPMNVGELLQAAPRTQSLFNTYISSLGLANAPQLDSTWRSALATATYRPANGQNSPQFRAAIIRNLGHQYPNGRNHKIYAAGIHWLWLRQFTK